MFASAQRSGKPTGLNTLGPAANGELLLLNDVRQPLSPNAIRALATALQDPTVGCATGNLVLIGSAGSGVYWRYENWIRRQESAFRGVVGMTGPIGMIRRADLGPLPADLILDDVWVPIRLALGGRRTVLVPEAQAQDAAFADQREFQRKVRTLAGNYQIFARLPRLLLPITNPIWFETFSHKLLRLAAPWLMVALLLVSLRGAYAAALDRAAARRSARVLRHRRPRPPPGPHRLAAPNLRRVEPGRGPGPLAVPDRPPAHHLVVGVVDVIVLNLDPCS